MENARFLECLAADYERIRAVALGNLDRQVPTCPEWTVADLLRHVGQVYLHKAAIMRDGAEPSPWPPPGLNDEEPAALLDRAYAELMAEFNRRDPGDFSPTWYDPDQTVGFWIRRMAQETVIHRVDAELAADAPVAPIPDDLATDGVDELLKTFVAYDVTEWPEDHAKTLTESPGRSYTIKTDNAEWRVETAPATFTVTGGPGTAAATDTSSDTAGTTITGTPPALLRWAWNRNAPGEPPTVTINGNPDLTEFQRSVVIATQ